MEKQKLILGLQAISATGILVLGFLSYFGQSARDLRGEIKDEFVFAREESAAVRKEMKAGFAAVSDEFAAVRKEMKEGFAAVRKEMKDEHAAIRRDMKDEHAAIRKEVRNINTRLGRVEGHLGIFPGKKPAP